MGQEIRIAVDARPLAFPSSGIGRYTSAVLQELTHQNSPHRFYLYCDRPITLPFALPSHWQQRTGNIKRRAFSTPFAQAVFPIWARCDDIDVFWSPRHHLPLMLSSRVHKVLTIHDVVWKRFPDTMTRGGQLVESLLMPASLRRADRIIAVSQFTKREIIELFHIPGGSIDVIYEASSLGGEHAPPLPTIEAPYFLFVGSNEPRKNLENLLLAYQRYRSTAANPAHLILAGSYQWGKFNVPAFIEQHDLQQYVHVLREISDATLRSLYSNAMALVMPSLYEGFGLPLVEAMQWGLPIVTSRNSALAEIAGNCALLISPYEPELICEALHQISDDEALRNELALRSRERGRQFSWRRAAMQTLDILQADAC